ncbi:hypothetical protein FQA47_007846 [Oryzias melastigma]|uniref:Uncharacterized protein n=1 Tax=Oryzias melastigma TaxID=30732 RepID=A0A834BSM3_ORYME|nr:hypothetical protein FQA47_007846 [Oryzias melastigma]
MRRHAESILVSLTLSNKPFHNIQAADQASQQQQEQLHPQGSTLRPSTTTTKQFGSRIETNHWICESHSFLIGGRTEFREMADEIRRLRGVDL